MPLSKKQRRYFAVLALGFMGIGSSNADNTSADLLLEARALFQPLEKAAISSEIGAQITALPFRSGESFKKGDLLVKFDCRLVDARVTIARAQLKADLKMLENKIHLKKLNSVGELEIELATAAYEKSKGELDVVRHQREKCTIKAPFSGRLVQAEVNAYETVAPGDPLLEILNDTELEVALVVPSGWLSWMKIGQAFQVRVDETGKQYNGTVSQLGATIDPVSQTISIYGKLDTAISINEIISGMSGTAVFANSVNKNQ